MAKPLAFFREVHYYRTATMEEHRRISGEWEISAHGCYNVATDPIGQHCPNVYVERRKAMNEKMHIFWLMVMLVGANLWASVLLQAEQPVLTETFDNPTLPDSPLRHLILLVNATKTDGSSLLQLDGPKVPTWGGVGEPNQGYYAGLPGKGFAKILEELWTQVSPSGAYWMPTRVLSDNRLAPFAADTSTYAFDAQTESEVNVEVVLLFRRAFIDLMDQKSWDTPDIVMEQQSLIVTVKE
jgi:hypothetical protein